MDGTVSAAALARELNTSVPRVVRAIERLGLDTRQDNGRMALRAPDVARLREELGTSPPRLPGLDAHRGRDLGGACPGAARPDLRASGRGARWRLPHHSESRDQVTSLAGARNDRATHAAGRARTYSRSDPHRLRLTALAAARGRDRRRAASSAASRDLRPECATKAQSPVLEHQPLAARHRSGRRLHRPAATDHRRPRGPCMGRREHLRQGLAARRPHTRHITSTPRARAELCRRPQPR